MSTAPPPLAAWLAATGTSIAELARRADTTWITVKRYASGEALVRGESNRHDLEIVRRIAEATSGGVSPAQILGVSDALGPIDTAPLGALDPSAAPTADEARAIVESESGEDAA